MGRTHIVVSRAYARRLEAALGASSDFRELLEELRKL